MSFVGLHVIQCQQALAEALAELLGKTRGLHILCLRFTPSPGDTADWQTENLRVDILCKALLGKNAFTGKYQCENTIKKKSRIKMYASRRNSLSFF